jgi:hypothetical protein
VLYIAYCAVRPSGKVMVRWRTRLACGVYRCPRERVPSHGLGDDADEFRVGAVNVDSREAVGPEADVGAERMPLPNVIECCRRVAPVEAGPQAIRQATAGDFAELGLIDRWAGRRGRGDGVARPDPWAIKRVGDGLGFGGRRGSRTGGSHGFATFGVGLCEDAKGAKARLHLSACRKQCRSI